jgi:hypothetical protein
MNGIRKSICGGVLAGGLFLLAGCGSLSVTNVRAVNASSGLTNYAIQVGPTQIVSNLPYGTEGVLPEGQYSAADTTGAYRPVGSQVNGPVLVYAQTASSPMAQVTQTLAQNSYYTIMTTGTAPGIGITVLTDDDSAPQSGDYKFRFVDTSAQAGPVDVYIVPPGTNLNGATPVLSGVTDGKVSSYLQLAPGSYVLQVTKYGNKNAVLYTVVFAPVANGIYSAFFLDPPSASSTDYSVLVTTDPVAAPVK